MKKYAALIAALVVVVAGCSDSSSDDAVTVNNAKAAARNSAGTNAVDCGTVEVQGSRAEANCCIATNYAQSTPAYALYMEMGIDSALATAVSIDNMKTVRQFGFSGNMGDFTSPVEGEVTEASCESPQLIENACSNSSALPFACS